MRSTYRTASASTVVLALMAPVAAGAADPPPAPQPQQLAQLSQRVTPPSLDQNSPAPGLDGQPSVSSQPSVRAQPGVRSQPGVRGQPGIAGQPEGTTPIQSRPRTPEGNSIRSSPEGLSARPGNNTSGDQTLELTPTPTSVPPRIGLFPAFGDRLVNLGIDFHGVAFDHFIANPSAGVQTGHTANLAALRPAVDLDLQRLVGLPGGNVHLGLTFFGLRSDIPQIITQAGGVLTGFQTTPATQTNLVSLFTYEQRLLGDKLSIEAGRTNVYNYFFLPNSLDPFSYFSTTVQVNGDFPSTPYPVWGGRVTYKLTPTVYLQGGVFEDNYRYATGYGDRLGTGLSSGTQFLAEIGQRSEFSNAVYPSNFEVGIEWNTRIGRSNLKGTGAPAIPLLERTNYPGGGVLYTQGLQTIWRGAKNDVGPPANIALFGSFDIALEQPQPISLDALAGVNFTGFIPGRPFDALGVQAHYQKLSKSEVLSETFKQNIIDGRGPRQRGSNYAVELVGNIQATPAIAFRPIVQYFINPDNYYPPAAGKNHRPQDGIEAGFFAVVSLGRLLGTSVKPN